MLYKLLFSIILWSISGLLYGQQNCIIINQQPQDQIIVSNNDVVLTDNISITFTIDATSTANLTYQWQLLNNSTNQWENIVESSEFSGATTAALTIVNVNSVDNEDRVRVVITVQDNSCSPLTSDEVVIIKIPIKIHNLFTPNNDGFNDTFSITGLDNPLFENNELKVFNRWGNMVYQKRNYDNDWDGTANSSFSVKTRKKVPLGTYFYTLDLNYRNIKLSGWVYIKL